ncbi:ribose 5-phosphate isomerase B [Sulfurospirillum halorespirans]|uniref:Ribose 5-phosphate isomerase B n=1 Tax=Sulfurospirillum halorespirans DSM 13726 TaxID=1193502 RepID=A0A1D7TIW8_9BACT|nr:ribose 5-phosphate isomerase B [Sulfurospirillum halorespirans]AOO64880.1 ribose 5-phosphate isomerase B [Sulfurospirillum halorespirans DSM 13726]
MKFFIATDHAGIAIKQDVIEMLQGMGHEVIDLGPFNTERVDYPDFAHALSLEVLKNSETQGILICGSGIGMSLAANKHVGIRAALCHDAYTAQMARAHNDANVLCFGQRVVGLGVIESMLNAWCATSFEGGRHAMRVEKLEL